MLKCGNVRVQVAPLSNDAAVTRPRAPPLDQRSCWNAAIRFAGLVGLTATNGSTSASGKTVPGPPTVQPANGLEPVARTSGPPTAGAATAGTAKVTVAARAPRAEISG